MADDPREKRRQERRRQMLDAAMAIVVDEGLEALTIAHLARRLNAAVGALYRYFDSKEALIVGLQQQALRMYYTDMQTDLERAHRLLEERQMTTGQPGVATIFRALVGFGAYLLDASRAPRRHRLLDAMVSAPAALLTNEQVAQVNQALAPILETCNGLLDAAVAVGALRPGSAPERTHLAWAALHGLDHFRKRDRVQPPELKVAALQRKMLASLFSGWGASGETLGAAFTLLDELRAAAD